MCIYEILARIMDQRKLSVANVAKMSGLPDSTVRGIITRKQKKVSLDVAFKLSDGLGISLEELHGMQSAAQAPSQPEDAVSREELHSFLVAAGFVSERRQLSDADLAFLSGVIDIINAWFANHKG